MHDPRAIAAKLLGTIDWQSEVFGFCRCPGAASHTAKPGAKDCRLSIDGAPTLFCFHGHCAGVVAETNRRLRQEIGASDWQITLPGGRVLRSGDIVTATGAIVLREAAPANPHASQERLILESLKVAAERFKPQLLETFRWTQAEIIESSPLHVCERDPRDQFSLWLRIWRDESTIWIGEPESSGKPEHHTHFRPKSDWYRIGPMLGNFTCASSFKPGSYSRCGENVNGQCFLVIESDVLSRDEIGAVFLYANLGLKLNLHCIVSTGGKSLHGWFDRPPTAMMPRLKATLTGFGCDPAMFSPSQPCRVPGVWRGDQLQKVLWIQE